jgi:hypothetical protein
MKKSFYIQLQYAFLNYEQWKELAFWKGELLFFSNKLGELVITLDD